MVLADSSYPLLNVFWTMLFFFCWIIWFWLLITVFSDLFRRHDVGGWAKAAWCFFVIVLPFLGVFIYLIADGKGMAERNAAQQVQAQKQFDDYVKQTAGSGKSSAGQIADAKALLDAGTINQAEFDSLKQKALVG